MKRPNYLELLRALAQANADFVVVGGVAAILRGAPVTTFDLDIVYSAEADNLERLANLLARLDSRYRDPAGRSIVPTVARLRDNRVNLLATECGALDLLQEIGDGWGFQQTFGRSTELSLEGFEIRVLELVSLIRAKEIADRPKDRVMLPILRETLRLSDSETR